MTNFDEKLRQMATAEDTPAPDGVDQRLADTLAALPGGARRLSRGVRTALIAACLCAAVVGTAFAVELIGQVSLTDHKDSASYSISADIVLWPMDELGGQMLEDAKEEDGRQLSLNSWEEVEEYWGVPLIRNTLLPTPKEVSVGLYKFQALDPDALQWADATCGFIIDNASIIWQARIYTEAYRNTEANRNTNDDSDIHLFGKSASIHDEHIYSQYEMKNGAVAQIVQVVPGDIGTTVPGYDAYFVRDGVLYELWVARRPVDETQPEADYEQHDSDESVPEDYLDFTVSPRDSQGSRPRQGMSQHRGGDSDGRQ